MGQIILAIVLPEARMDRVMARIHLAANVKRIAQEGKEAEQCSKRLGRVYLDGVSPEPENHRKMRLLHDTLASLVVRGVRFCGKCSEAPGGPAQAVRAAGMGERRRPLVTMLDTVEEE